MRAAMFRSVVLVASALMPLSCGGDSGGPAGPDDDDDGPPDLTRNASIQGTLAYETLDIPAGVTITATGPLVLNVAGSVSIAGTLAGDCVPITINGNSTVELTGAVRNGCATAPDGAAPALTVLGNGDMMIDGATFESAGDVEIRNDPTLTEAAFGAPAPVAPLSAAAANASAITVSVRNARYIARPARAKNGTPGQTGTNGADGANWRLLARGDLILGGGNLIQGQHGGHGGAGTHQGAPAAAQGGRGGNGGRIAVLATGQLAIGGSNNNLVSGSGGDGGAATATANPGTAPRAPDATATAGDGGDPGLVRIEGQAGLTVNSGLNVTVGDGGVGGEATATAADGQATVCENGKAQSGGHAIARGGRGGSSPDRKLRELGGVTINAQPSVSGGHGGPGGKATANGGNGATAVDCDNCKDGGDGGNFEAHGGAGGHARIRDLNNDLIGDGGDGGASVHNGGNGGAGANCCDPTPKPGGDGGNGGDAIGGDGARGTGRANGAFGGVTVGSGRGGNAGAGAGPGTKGIGGTNRTAAQPSTTPANTKFPDGADANSCGGEPADASEIAGNFSLTGTKTADTCPAGLFPGSINNPGPIVVQVLTGTTTIVRILSDTQVNGPLGDDGSYDGTGVKTVMLNGSPFVFVERVLGFWKKVLGIVRLEGRLEFRLEQGSVEFCRAEFDVTYIRLSNEAIGPQ